MPFTDDIPPLPAEPGDLADLRAIVAGTVAATGEDFLRRLVEQLAIAMGTNHAFVAEFVPPQLIRTLAFWSHGEHVPNIEYELPNTPCERVIGGDFCSIPRGTQNLYPDTEAGVESYLGVPLKATDGTVLGHLCVFDERPMPDEPRRLYIFQIFAARAAAELQRLHVEQQLRTSEERFRDLFEEAPFAYVHEGLDSRFIRANRTARRILGLSEEEARDFVGMSLVADTDEAQRRVRAAFEAVARGADTGGVVLEMRRKDDGRPVWIEWWSRPDPGGQFTRTMFIDITERVLLEREQARLRQQNLYLQEEIKSVHNFEEIVGASPSLTKVLEQVRRVATTDATVLILGETGTGKELIARAVHSASRRADKPFIKINCAALPAGLVESELFGHERGAFSGAIQRRVGRFELANGGTIFLDEIGEVPMDVQVKLLRVLQEQEFERIGGNQTIHSDVRVIAATNRDLPKAIADGTFRADLYYRLNVFPLLLPPLRERGEDIALLARFFVQKYATRIGRRIEAIDRESIGRLLSYPWPGNVRELENIIERALILETDEVLRIGPEALPTVSRPLPAAAPAPAPDSHPGVPVGADDEEEGGGLDQVQRQHILDVLRQTRWVIEGERGAARRLDMKPATLRHRMKKLGIARRPGADD